MTTHSVFGHCRVRSCIGCGIDYPLMTPENCDGSYSRTITLRVDGNASISAQTQAIPGTGQFVATLALWPRNGVSSFIDQLTTTNEFASPLAGGCRCIAYRRSRGVRRVLALSDNVVEEDGVSVEESI